MRDGASRRVLAVYEPGRRGSAALDVARELVGDGRSMVTVVNVAPQVTAQAACCGTSWRQYNEAVREQTAEELLDARASLGSLAERVGFEMLVEGVDPPLGEWVGARGFDLVLLPARRRLVGRARHPDAARLQAVITGEVRVVDAGTPAGRRGAESSWRMSGEQQGIRARSQPT